MRHGRCLPYTNLLTACLICATKLFEPFRTLWPAGGIHEQQFGWKTFRVLTVTTDLHRARSMTEMLRRLHAPKGPGPALFLFALCELLRKSDPIAFAWQDGNGRELRLI